MYFSVIVMFDVYHNPEMWDEQYYRHFMDEKIEAQRLGNLWKFILLVTKA